MPTVIFRLVVENINDKAYPSPILRKAKRMEGRVCYVFISLYGVVVGISSRIFMVMILNG